MNKQEGYERKNKRDTVARIRNAITPLVCDAPPQFDMVHTTAVCGGFPVNSSLLSTLKLKNRGIAVYMLRYDRLLRKF